MTDSFAKVQGAELLPQGLICHEIERSHIRRAAFKIDDEDK
jgi:hypothetical protein